MVENQNDALGSRRMVADKSLADFRAHRPVVDRLQGQLSSSVRRSGTKPRIEPEGQGHAADSPSDSGIRFWEKTVEWLYVRRYFPLKGFAAPLGKSAEEAGDVLLRFEDADAWCLIEFKKDQKAFVSEQVKYPAFENEKWVQFGTPEKKAEAKKAFLMLTEIWKAPASKLSKPAPHIFIYGEPVKTNEFIELEEVQVVLKEVEALHLDETRKNALSTLRKIVEDKRKAAANWKSIRLLGMSYWGSWCNDSRTCADVPDGTPREISDLKVHGWELEAFKIYVKILIAAKRGVLVGDGDGGNDGGGGGEIDDRANWDFGTILGMSADGRIATFTMFEFAVEFGLFQQLTPSPTPLTGVRGYGTSHSR